MKTQYLKKYDFSRSFKKIPQRVKKKLKTPKIAPMLHFNYQIKIPAPNYNPTKKSVLAVKVFWCYFQKIKFFMIF
jgi:hypothetical protein